MSFSFEDRLYVRNNRNGHTQIGEYVCDRENPFERTVEDSIYAIPLTEYTSTFGAIQEPPLGPSYSNGVSVNAAALVTQLGNTSSLSDSSTYVIPNVSECGVLSEDIYVKKRKRRGTNRSVTASRSMSRRSHRCNSCREGFSRGDDLARHLERTDIHGNLKVYRCRTCSNHFRRKDALKASSHGLSTDQRVEA